MSYKTHTVETAPESAKATLAAAQKSLGFVPNLYAVMAEAPALLEAYTTIGAIFDKTSFSAAERQIVLLAASRTNGCEYCVAAHSVIAGMQKVPAEIVGAVREGKPIADRKLEALRRFATAVVDARGNPPATEIDAFLAAGYAPRQVLEVVLGVGMKILSNYTNHLANTPLDAAFEPAAWSKKAA